MVSVIRDEDLISQIKNGDSSAFMILYYRYKDLIYGYSLRMLLDRQKAEDVVQETFLKLYQHCETIRSPASLRTWLFTTARNEVLMIMRKNSETIALMDDRKSSTENPLEAVQKKNMHDIISEKIDELKTDYKEIILLREFQQLSYEEIAVVLETTVSSVKSKLFKARKELHKKLIPYYIERDGL